MKSRKKAFTLIELSVVLIIIGLIVTGIVAGKSLVDVAKLSGARSTTNTSPVHSIENVVLWLDATSAEAFSVETPEDGDLIATWDDLKPKTITKNNATQTGADSLKPTYALSAINGIPAVRFDGIDDYLKGGPIGVSGSDGITIFVVFRDEGTTANDAGLFQYGSSIGTAAKVKRINPYGPLRGGWRFSNGNRIFNEDIVSDKSYIGTWMCADGCSYQQHNRYLNGTLSTQYSTASGTTIPNVLDEEYIIGIARSSSNTLIQPYKGVIGEIIVFDINLNSTQRETVEKYLSSKWRIDLD